MFILSLFKILYSKFLSFLRPQARTHNTGNTGDHAVNQYLQQFPLSDVNNPNPHPQLRNPLHA